jgi:hypothetical protein
MIKTNKIEHEFKRIKQLGYIQSRRSNNTGIGKTFEDYLGVTENNIPDPDFKGFEVKSQRFLSESKVTLFTKKPTHPLNINSYIRETYGEVIRGDNNLKEIHTSFFCNKYNTYKKFYGFKLDFRAKKERLYIIIKDLKTNRILEKNIYYSFNDLYYCTLKLKNLFIVTAETKKVRGKEYFHFTEGKVFLDFSFEKFLEYIKTGIIQYDIRIGSYKSGINYGKIHDHGSGFRIHRNRLKDLYKEYLELK